MLLHLIAVFQSREERNKRQEKLTHSISYHLDVQPKDSASEYDLDVDIFILLH